MVRTVKNRSYYDYDLNTKDKTLYIVDNINLSSSNSKPFVSVTNNMEDILSYISKESLEDLSDYTISYKDTEGEHAFVLASWEGYKCLNVKFIIP